mmetsp:Transcript_28375/g.64263  ORF Transcript_28375/g.64263 Transcript_28375/m.64263 type:complete len:308 (+) Transcript_28375:673-1596(+)
MDAALRLLGAVLVHQVDEAALALRAVVEPDRLVAGPLALDPLDRASLTRDARQSFRIGNRHRVLGVTLRRVAPLDGGVERHALLSSIVEAVLERPVRERVQFGQSTTDRRNLGDIDVGALSAVVAAAAVDHDVRVQRLETALEGLNLADFVILLNVLLPQVGTVLLVEVGERLGREVTRRWQALRAEHVRGEAVLLLDCREEGHRVVEKVVGVHNHDLRLAGFERADLAEQVGDDAVADDHRVREDDAIKLVHRHAQRRERLLLEVLKASFLGILDELGDVHAHRSGSHARRDHMVLRRAERAVQRV